jgi:hypothetical protein
MALAKSLYSGDPDVIRNIADLQLTDYSDERACKCLLFGRQLKAYYLLAYIRTCDIYSFIPTEVLDKLSRMSVVINH